MIASVVMAIIFMGFISSITGAFLATNAANRASESQAAARDLLEEATELGYADMLLLDGNAFIAPTGLVSKFRVYEVSPGLGMVEVEVCRPTTAISLATLTAMTMPQLDAVSMVNGSRIRFSMLSTGNKARAGGIAQSGLPTAGTTSTATTGDSPTGTGSGAGNGGLGGLMWWW
jgi:hypothetical protein